MVSATLGVIGVFNGATLSSTTLLPLIQLNNTSLGGCASASICDVLAVVGTGGAGGTTVSSVSLNGPLLSAENGSSLTFTGSLASLFTGGQVVVSGSTAPLVSLNGGTHSIGSLAGRAMFMLFGRSSATAVDPETELTLGTDKPLQHGGVLLETSGATVSGQKALRIDTALLEASAPLLNLKSGSAGSVFTTSEDALDLSFRAKVTSLGPLFRLDASTLNVNSGALINVAGGSFLKVTGDLLHLNNGSTININSLSNGFLINASGNSVLNVSGALVNFGGTGGNSIVVKNNVAPTTTLSVGGFSFPVNVTNGATVNISGTPIKGAALGAISLPNGGSVIRADGANTKVIISGN
jgi:hypothetical protein